MSSVFNPNQNAEGRKDMEEDRIEILSDALRSH